ncbi:MAG TPA: ABC transporter ATP-binding protein [Desulfobacteraceae bacterium]|nr:ABC transporter ATP-binding protein [Desulfobacteraceae bacterium]
MEYEIVSEALTKFYGLKMAIEDVNFCIRKGEVVGFLGPNGAGKSTILKILTCFLRPTKGRVIIDGMDIIKRSIEIRRLIGFLPENVPLYSELRVRDFLRFCGRLKGLSRQRLRDDIERVVEICDISHIKDSLIRHLSKGLKQRVGLSQALLGDPSIVILDEPTSGLDPVQRVEMKRLLRRLSGKKTVIISTHILKDAQDICDRVIILKDGKVLREDTPEGISKAIEGQRLISLKIKEGAKEEIEELLRNISGVHEVILEDEGEIIIKADFDPDIRPEVARSIIDKGYELLELKELKKDLEDSFFYLIKGATE